MIEYITTYEDWYQEFKKDKSAIWIKAHLSDGKEIYFKDYKRWQDIKKTCRLERLDIHGVSLQFKSNIVHIDTKKADGVYLVRSIKGQIGGNSQHYYTVGIVDGDTVRKGMWLTPELLEEENFEDPLDKCFKEAIIYNHARSTHRKKPV